MEIALTLLLVAVVGYVWYKSRARQSAGSDLGNVNPSKRKESASNRVRLTEQQIVVLSAASRDKPIFGENPSLIHSQMPEGRACFNIRTVESLVSRGFLRSDGKGGYLLTPEGEKGLRSGMGF